MVTVRCTESLVITPPCQTPPGGPQARSPATSSSSTSRRGGWTSTSRRRTSRGGSRPASPEEDAPDPGSFAAPRIAAEEAALSLAGRGVRASVVRLPYSVHGEGDHGFVPALIGIARAKGVSASPGDGANRGPAVHRLDAAHLFRLALEAAPAGARLHGVDDEGVPFRDIAEVIGRHLKLPASAIPREEAGSHFGWLGPIVTVDHPASSTLTQKQLGWHPARPALIPDLDEGHYFGGQPRNFLARPGGAQAGQPSVRDREERRGLGFRRNQQFDEIA
jgi:nucleoside-diphosphate-sugar epimerase